MTCLHFAGICQLVDECSADVRSSRMSLALANLVLISLSMDEVNTRR